MGENLHYSLEPLKLCRYTTQASLHLLPFIKREALISWPLCEGKEKFKRGQFCASTVGPGYVWTDLDRDRSMIGVRA